MLILKMKVQGSIEISALSLYKAHMLIILKDLSSKSTVTNTKLLG